LSLIAQRAYGAGVLNEFYRVNANTIGPNPNAIDVGMVLQVPCSLRSPMGEPASAAAQPTQTAVIGPIGNADFDAAPIEIGNGAGDVAAPDGAEVVLTFNKASAPNFIINVGIVDPYLAKVKEVTEGRVQFVDPAIINRDARAQLDLVRAGEVDAAYVFNGYLGASHPLLQLPMQPLMGGTAYQTAVALWRLEDRYLAAKDHFEGGIF